MEWISVKKKLPTEHKRYLALCRNLYNDDTFVWEGIVEVYFDPMTGWHRCENYDTKPVRVMYWIEMIELPKDK